MMGLLDEIERAADDIMRKVAEIRREAAEMRHDQTTAAESLERREEGDDDRRR